MTAAYPDGPPTPVTARGFEGFLCGSRRGVVQGRLRPVRRSRLSGKIFQRTGNFHAKCWISNFEQPHPGTASPGLSHYFVQATGRRIPVSSNLLDPTKHVELELRGPLKSKAAPVFASVIRNSHEQKWGDPRCSDRGTPPDEATQTGTIPLLLQFFDPRESAAERPAYRARRVLPSIIWP